MRAYRCTGRWAALLAVVCLLSAPGSAEALEVSVHGESGLDVDIEPAGTTVRIKGRLYDDVGSPLPVQPLGVAVRESGQKVFDSSVQTDFFGRFWTFVEVEPGIYAVEVDYGGSSHVSGTRKGETIEVHSAPVDVSIKAPRWVYGSETAVPVEVRAMADGRGLPGYATMGLGDRPVASIDLDYQGRGRFDIASYLEPGDNEMAVVLEATDHRPGAGIEARVRRVDDLAVEGAVERVFRRGRRGQQVDLQLRDEYGPIDGAVIDVRFERSPQDRQDNGSGDDSTDLVERVETDSDGRAVVLFSDDDIGEHRWEVSATVEPPAGEVIEWQGGSVEQGTPEWIRAVQILAILALVGGLLWMGRRAVSGLWEIVVERFESSDSQPPGPEDDLNFERVERVELTPSKPGSPEPDEHDKVVIELWDEWRNCPVQNARVSLEGLTADEGSDVEPGSDGHIEIEVAPKTTYVIEARAPGFVPATSRFDGDDARGRMRLKMTAVPLRIRRAYRQMVRRTGGDDPWGRLTPRQVEEALRSINDQFSQRDDRQDGADVGGRWPALLEQWRESDEQRRPELLLRAITALVEETNFSGRAYKPDVWDVAREAMEKLAEELDDDVPEAS